MADNNGERDQTSEQLPLAGIILCCTSIPPDRRSAIAVTAAQMGAQHKLDLTSDVTHLLVGDTDTPKYKYVARERPDVKCLLSEFIDAVRDSWLEGGQTDIEALEHTWAVPAFWGLRVCVTGFQDLEERKHIEDVVKREGGEYRGDLTKEVTHLVCKEARGQKYSHAKLWGIKAVSKEWFWESARRGMVLEEGLFDPLMDPEERGKGAWKKEATVEVGASTRTSFAKRGREDNEGGGAKGSTVGPARKLRRTASAKFSTHSEGIWMDIVSGGFEQQEGKRGEWDEEGEKRALPRNGELKERSVSHGGELRPSLPPLPRTEIEPVARQGLFSNKRFYLHGFDPKQTSVLKRHLSSQNGHLLPELSQLSSQTQPSFLSRTTSFDTSISTSVGSSFLLVPHTSFKENIPSSTADAAGHETSLEAAGVATFTELWVEKRLLGGTLADAAYRPFKFPMIGFERLVISTTGLADIDLLHVCKIIKLLGATYDGQLNNKTSMLLCDNKVSMTREKVQHALKWDVPVVRIDWLWHCIETGEQKPWKDYVLNNDEPPSEGPAPTTNEPKRRLFQDPFGATSVNEAVATSKPVHTISSASTKADPLGTRRRRSQSRSSLGGSASVEDSFQTCTEGPETLQGLPVLDVDVADNADMNYATFDTTRVHEMGVQRESRSLPITPTALRTRLLPLKERSPNSPLKIALSPSRFKLSPTISVNSVKEPVFPQLPLHSRQGSHSRPNSASADKSITSNANEGLASAISTLLAARHQSNSATAVPGRRKPRSLHGRASSNLSARAAASRASSVDTLNTDGVGTPVESAGLGAGGGGALSRTGSGANPSFGDTLGTTGGEKEIIGRLKALESAGFLTGELDPEPDVESQKAPEPPLTQVGYGDEEGGAFRADLAKRMGWDGGDDSEELDVGPNNNVREEGEDADEPFQSFDAIKSTKGAKYGGRAKMKTPKKALAGLAANQDGDTLEGKCLDTEHQENDGKHGRSLRKRAVLREEAPGWSVSRRTRLAGKCQNTGMLHGFESD